MKHEKKTSASSGREVTAESNWYCVSCDKPVSLCDCAPVGREATAEPYPLYSFCAEQLPDDWRERSSGEVAHIILTAAADPAAPSPSARETTASNPPSGLDQEAAS